MVGEICTPYDLTVWFFAWETFLLIDSVSYSSFLLQECESDLTLNGSSISGVHTAQPAAAWDH